MHQLEWLRGHGIVDVVLCVGYGECWPGYIPTPQAFQENFNDVWYWVAPGSDQRIQAALDMVLPNVK